MSTIGIVKIHEVIVRHNGQYCCICFRPASDRKLVEPVHLRNFISKLTNANGFKNKIQVCYICEGLAQSAVRFVRAVELASRVNDLFNNMDQTRWRNIVNYLREPNTVPKVLNRQLISHRALELEESLRSTPRYELRRTDTLVVPSPPRPRLDTPIVMQHANPVIPTVMSPLTPVMPIMTHMATMAPPVSIMTPMTTMAPPVSIMTPMATMAPPVSIMTPMTTMAPPVSIMTPMATVEPRVMATTTQKIFIDQDLKVVKVVNKESKQIILHPMVQSIDGNVYVPSLQLQILDNGVLKSVTNVSNVPNVIQTSPPLFTAANPENETKRNIPQKEQNAEKNKSDYYNFLVSQTSPPLFTAANPQNETKRNIPQKEQNAEKNKSDYYNFLVSQMEQKQSQNAEVIKMNDLNIVLNDDDSTSKKRKRRQGSVEKTLSDVQLLLNKNAEGSCEVKYEIIDDDDDVTKESRIEPPAKEPVERTDRTVDWEDKIPMDVISFMDATDPNPEERIMQPQPMGFISDVRSVPNETIDSIECIDLC